MVAAWRALHWAGAWHISKRPPRRRGSEAKHGRPLLSGNARTLAPHACALRLEGVSIGSGTSGGMAAASEGTPVPGAAGSQGEGPGLPGRQRADTAMSGAADGAPVAKGRSKRWGMEVSVACWVVQCLCSLHSACLPLVQDYVANPQAKLQDLPAHFHDADFDPVRWVLVSSPEGQQRQPAGHTAACGAGACAGDHAAGPGRVRAVCHGAADVQG